MTMTSRVDTRTGRHYAPVQSGCDQHMKESKTRHSQHVLFMLATALMAGSGFSATPTPQDAPPMSSKARQVGAAISAGLDAKRAFAADGWIWAPSAPL